MQAQVVIDFFGVTWCFRDNLHEWFTYAPEESVNQLIVCNGLKEADEDQQIQLKNLLDRKFEINGKVPSISKLPPHRINVGDNKPIRQRIRQSSHKIKLETWKLVDEMLEQDIIEPCESDWSSPVVLVKKPNGKKCFCVDFRKVNSVTKRDATSIAEYDGNNG
jgi:hypothetical protein